MLLALVVVVSGIDIGDSLMAGHMSTSGPKQFLEFVKICNCIEMPFHGI